MKLGSLFDGSGGFPLAGALCDFSPAWASEVEPYPIAVTRSRFPNMIHLGNVSKINGSKIEPVDVLCFGFPCQDVSVAGKRKSVKHEDNGDDETTRSGLVWEAIRIIKEMRGATNGEYPRFAVFENVPGLFSAEKGEAFRTVVEGLIQVAEPSAVMPEVPKKGWAYADCYVGNGWSFAYRIFDAQYIRTAQRRRRVYAILCLADECAGEILFKRESLRGYFTESGTERQGTPSDVERGVGADDREGTDQGAGKSSASVTEDISPTLACTHDGAPVVALDRASFNQGENALYEPQFYEDGTTSTIVAKGPSAVCYWDGTQTAGTLTAQNASGSQRMPDKENFNCVVHTKPRYIVRRLTPTECARLQGFPDLWGHPDKKTDFTDEEYRFWLEVRNTHAEINGRAVKDYTKKQMLTWYNKLHTDSAEYKMWGNGIALPCALYVMQGIADTLKGEN